MDKDIKMSPQEIIDVYKLILPCLTTAIQVDTLYKLCQDSLKKTLEIVKLKRTNTHLYSVKKITLELLRIG